MTIVFEDPPAPVGRGAAPKVIHHLAPLRERPGQWARVWVPLRRHHTAQMKASDLKAGRFSHIAEGEYDAVARKVDDVSYVWVRYVGPVQ